MPKDYRIKEHCYAKSNDPKIYKHINACEDFKLNSNFLLNLPFNESSLLTESLIDNTVIIDKHWLILLCKEAFYIHRHKPIFNAKLKPLRNYLYSIELC